MLGSRLDEHHVTAIVVSRPGVLQQALRTSLNAYTGVTVVASCGDGLSALEQVAIHRPQMLIVDTNLLDEEVAALVVAAKVRMPGLYCMVIQQTGKRGAIALHAGADAVVTRDQCAQDLHTVLKQVLALPRQGDA